MTWTETPTGDGLYWRSERYEEGWCAPELTSVSGNTWRTLDAFTRIPIEDARAAVRWMPVVEPDRPEAGRLSPLPIGTRARMLGGREQSGTIVGWDPAAGEYLFAFDGDAVRMHPNNVEPIEGETR